MCAARHARHRSSCPEVRDRPEVRDQVLATHGDTGTAKLMADSGPGNAQLGTDVAQGSNLGVQVGCPLNVHSVTVTAQFARTWSAVLVISCVGSARRIRWPLGCDVLVEVEEVAGIVGTLDLDQAIVVLAVVVLDLVVIVVLHEVDVAAGL
jgi:hypothetical protein